MNDKTSGNKNNANNKRFYWKTTYSYLIVGLAIVLAIGGGVLVRNKRNQNLVEPEYTAELQNDTNHSVIKEKDELQTDSESNDSEIEDDNEEIVVDVDND